MKKILLFALITLILLVGGYFVCQKFFNKSDSGFKIQNENIPVSGNPVTLPSTITDNKFGFLSGGGDETSLIKEMGANWVRPHPGPFLWDRLQISADSQYDFTEADEQVLNYQSSDLGILATIWPFADWDQQNRSDVADCKVSSNDEFLKKNDKKGRLDYLPEYRCNPNDWDAYSEWVTAMIERYDGDGTNDMPGLKYPIKHWEVMNEPDLDDMGDGRLDFYKQGAEDYGKLLKKTYSTIKSADSTAQVLIAGAAGSNLESLDFYKDVFEISGTRDAFDIANIHCISNGDYLSYNVEPYKAMLAELNIDRPIWVTEAEAMLSRDTNTNASQAYASTKKALELGAERIFYTQYSFENSFSNQPVFKGQQTTTFDKIVDGSDPVEAYQEITSL